MRKLDGEELHKILTSETIKGVSVEDTQVSIRFDEFSIVIRNSVDEDWMANKLEVVKSMYLISYPPDPEEVSTNSWDIPRFMKKRKYPSHKHSSEPASNGKCGSSLEDKEEE